MDEADALRVRVLGGFAVEGVDEHRLGSRKARQLLKALALARRRPVAADALAELLWADAPPASPRDQVAVLVSRLRRVLGPHRLVRSDAGYALAVDWLDLDELGTRVDEALAALAAGRLAAARAAASAALAIARGDVLPEEEGPWVESERARAIALVRQARQALARAAEASADPATAVAAAEAALADDPFDEASLRILMRGHVALGRPASALAACARAREHLAAELGVPLDAETESLHDAIVVGELRPSPRVVGPPPPGRAREAGALDEALVRCTARRSAEVVVLEGEAGIGKTTLLESWLSTLEGRAVVLHGRAGERARDLPLQPVVDALAGLEAAGGVEVDATGLGKVDADLRLVPDVEARRLRLFSTLRATVLGLGGDRPVVLAVDDLHHAGPATVAWIGFASRAPAPLLLVVATRPTTDADRLEDATVLRLGPLGVEDVAEIVGPAAAPEVHERSGGIPLLLSAVLGGDDGARTVEDAVARRAGALGAGEEVVRAAALLGDEVDLDLLADVVELSAAVVLRHLERAVDGGVLVERGATFRFRHGLERDALRSSTGGPRRALLHRRAARALARRSPPDAAAVADHARMGGDVGLAVPWYVRAADAALARTDVDTADRLLGTALSMADGAAPRVARARVRAAAGRLEEAAADAARALGRERSPAALEAAGWVAYYRRLHDEALALAEEAVATAVDPAVRTSCLALAGRIRHAAGDLAGGAQHLEAATAITPAGAATALARVWLASARLHQGRPDDALGTLPAQLTSGDHPFAPLHARFARVLALGQAGRLAEALVVCDDIDRAVEESGRIGQRFAGVAANCRGWLLRWCGLGERADEQNRRAVDAAEDAGMEEARYAGQLDLVDGRLLAGDHDAAATGLAALGPLAADDGWHGTMAWHQRHRHGLLQARLAAAAGDPERAAELASAVAADARARGAARYEALATGLVGLFGDRGAVDAVTLDAAVAGLARCAAIDGWWLVAALGARHDVPAWRAAADAAVARAVRQAPDGAAIEALATRLLAGDGRP